MRNRHCQPLWLLPLGTNGTASGKVGRIQPECEAAGLRLEGVGAHDVLSSALRLPVKTEAKLLLSTSAFSLSLDRRSPFSFSGVGTQFATAALDSFLSLSALVGP